MTLLRPFYTFFLLHSWMRKLHPFAFLAQFHTIQFTPSILFTPIFLPQCGRIHIINLLKLKLEPEPERRRIGWYIVIHIVCIRVHIVLHVQQLQQHKSHSSQMICPRFQTSPTNPASPPTTSTTSLPVQEFCFVWQRSAAYW